MTMTMMMIGTTNGTIKLKIKRRRIAVFFMQKNWNLTDENCNIKIVYENKNI